MLRVGVKICNSSLVHQSKKHHLVIREGSGRFYEATVFILDTVDTAGNGMFLENHFASQRLNVSCVECAVQPRNLAFLF